MGRCIYIHFKINFKWNNISVRNITVILTRMEIYSFKIIQNILRSSMTLKIYHTNYIKESKCNYILERNRRKNIWGREKGERRDTDKIAM